MTTDSSRGRSLAARGPVRSAERQLAPDLARGAMLLFIALVNAHRLSPPVARRTAHYSNWPSAPSQRGALPCSSMRARTRSSPSCSATAWCSSPVASRRRVRLDQVRALLLRRSAWLFVFGCAHATFLYFGDFLGAYAIIGAVAVIALLGRAKLLSALLGLWAISVVELGVLAGARRRGHRAQ